MTVRREHTPFLDLYEGEQLCQGDLVCKPGAENGGLGAFGVIITADCDIIQGKAGDDLSMLRMVSAPRYINQIWAAAEVKRIAKRQGDLILQPINSAIAKSSKSLNLLDQDGLFAWLALRQPGEILDALDITTRSGREDCLRGLECMREGLAVAGGGDAIDALKRAWMHLGTSSKKVRERLSDVFNPSRGASDIYFIPYLPGFDDIGFVILLRSFLPLPHANIYSHRTDLRISGNENGYYRIGRFRDGVKYSIVQSAVNLFSRIGLSEIYENENRAAVGVYPPCIRRTNAVYDGAWHRNPSPRRSSFASFLTTKPA